MCYILDMSDAWNIPPLKSESAKNPMSQDASKMEGQDFFAQACYQELLKHLTWAALAFDGKGKIIFCNDQACSSFKYKREEIHQNHFRGLVANDDWAQIMQMIYEGLQGNYGSPHMIRFRNKDMKTFVAEVISLPYYEAGLITGTCLIFSNYTARKEEEAKGIDRTKRFIAFSEEIDAWRDQAEQLKERLSRYEKP